VGALPAASDPAEIMSAAADLIWPLLLVGAIVLLYRHRKTVGPALREILNNRNVGVELPGIKLNIGGEQIPAQEAVGRGRHRHAAHGGRPRASEGRNRADQETTSRSCRCAGGGVRLS